MPKRKPPPPIIAYIRASKRRERADAFRARRKAAWERGEAGAEQAADHAERVEPGWNDEAMKLLRAFAFRRGLADTFMIEEVRAEAEDGGFAAPPSNRAWGAVALRARRDGLIERVGAGYTSRGPGNATFAGVWRLAHG